jgi:hypothetical protein
MRKKLVSLGFALTALVAASALAPASATTPVTNPCPAGTHLFTCNTYSYCCPMGAFCICHT